MRGINVDAAGYGPIKRAPSFDSRLTEKQVVACFREMQEGAFTKEGLAGPQ